MCSNRQLLTHRRIAVAKDLVTVRAVQQIRIARRRIGRTALAVKSARVRERGGGGEHVYLQNTITRIHVVHKNYLSNIQLDGNSALVVGHDQSDRWCRWWTRRRI